jgi:hypothetical protein
VKVVSHVTAQPSKLSNARQTQKLISEVCTKTLGDTSVRYIPKNDTDFVSKTPQIHSDSPNLIVGVIFSEPLSSLKGKVVDHSGNPIAFATVAIKGTKIAVAADSVGRFTINPKFNRKNVILSVSSVGFAPLEKNIRQSDYENDVEIELQQTGTLGEVVVVNAVNAHRMGLVGSVKSYRTCLLNINDMFKFKNNFRVYPNPIRSNSTLTMEWNQKQNGDHLLQLFNQSGQLILSKDIYIDEKARLFTMNMPSIISGNYFLKLTSKATGRSYTEKLIVE